MPPRCEQERIASFLDTQTAHFSALSAKVQEAIDHLREFRTALISAAVTGKIDVRTPSAEATAGQGGTR
jgi:transcriptional regulator